MKIVPEAEQLDTRAPLVLLLTAVVILASSGLLTVLVRSLGRPEPPSGGLSLAPPAGVPAATVGTEPVQAAWLFDTHGAASSTRSPPAALEQYGWVSRERGLVRIPIARAKQLYLQRRLPARPGSAPSLTAPATQRELP